MDPAAMPADGQRNMTALAEHYIHTPVPQHFSAGVVVASIVVAFLGAWSALLLLGKRTSSKGARNIALLFLAAMAQSAVGIWGMHGIGMFSMTLKPTPDVDWHVGFSAAFTALSLIVPLLALCIAFFLLDFTTFRYWRAIVSGVATGATIGFMHYSASFRTRNFHVEYQPAVLVVSILLAMAAATVALTLFFRFKAHWDDGWWKRALCAFALAVAVSSMHYTGMAGTKYRVRADLVNEVAALGHSNESQVLVAASVMCAFFLLLSLAITLVDTLVAKRSRQNARKVVICSATFNKQGQLLVKEDGTLPMVVIETPMRHSEVLTALDRRQSTFQWMYAVSWDWDMVSDFLKAISMRLFALEHAVKPERSGNASTFWSRLVERRRSLDGGPGAPGSPQALADFRDRFIDAAGQLAVQLDVPFQRIGVLYDQVMPTGTRRAAEQAAREAGISLHGSQTTSSEDASESGVYRRPPSIFAEGEKENEGAMLFLVRRMSDDATSRESEERYLQRGYRMTDVRFLGSHLANHYAVQKKDMEAWLGRLKMYARRGTRPVVQPGPAVYVGLFGVRASTTQYGGLEALVYGFARHQIPAYRLPKVEGITPQIRYWVKLLDRMTLEDATETCHREANKASERLKSLSAVRSSREALRGARDDDEEDEERNLAAESDSLDTMASFQRALGVALEALENSMRFYPQLKSTARLSADILEVPSSLDGSTDPAQMIVVQAVLPDERADLQRGDGAHPLIDASQAIPTDQVSPNVPFVYVPYSLFSKAQMMLIRGRQAEQFERSVASELRARYPGVCGVPGISEEGEARWSYDDDVDVEKGTHSPAASPMTARFASLLHPRSPSRRKVEDIEAVEMMSTPHSPVSMKRALSTDSMAGAAIRGQSSVDWTTVQTLERGGRSRGSTGASTTTCGERPTSAGNGSLGIRRFLGGGAEGQPAAAPPASPRHQRSASIGAVLSQDEGAALTSLPRRVSVRRQRSVSAANTATAPVPTAVAPIQRLRPRVPDVEPRRAPQHRFAAAESAASGSNGSDDWMARRLSEIERAPGGSALLGVDW